MCRVQLVRKSYTNHKHVQIISHQRHLTGKYNNRTNGFECDQSRKTNVTKRAMGLNNKILVCKTTNKKYHQHNVLYSQFEIQNVRQICFLQTVFTCSHI